MEKLTQLSRLDNAKALETLKKNGITLVDPPSEEVIASYEEIGKKARRLLIGRLFSEDLLNRVEKNVSDCRASRSKNSK